MYNLQANIITDKEVIQHIQEVLFIELGITPNNYTLNNIDDGYSLTYNNVEYSIFDFQGDDGVVDISIFNHSTNKWIEKYNLVFNDYLNKFQLFKFIY